MVDEKIAEFAETAREYCACLEEILGSPIDLETVRLLLAKLHTGILSVEPPRLLDDMDGVCPTAVEDEAVRKRLVGLPFDHYWNVGDSTKEQPVCAGSLVDDIVDIWCDPCEGLSLFDSGHPGAASWDWKQSFDTHWGHHLVSAQHAIHCHLTL